MNTVVYKHDQSFRKAPRLFLANYHASLSLNRNHTEQFIESHLMRLKVRSCLLDLYETGQMSHFPETFIFIC